MNRFNKLALWMLKEMRYEITYAESRGMPLWMAYDQKNSRYISFSENKIIVGNELMFTVTGNVEIEKLKEYLKDENYGKLDRNKQN